MSRRARSSIAMAILALFVVPIGAGTAQAQDSAAAAEALFQEGRRLFDAGDIHGACAKLAESQRLQAGTGTLLNLAICHERQGLLATAMAEYGEVSRLAAEAGHGERERFARGKESELGERVPRLRLRMALADDATSAWVLLDGARLESAALGAPFPVNPGEHDIEVHAPARAPWSIHLTTAERSGVVEVKVPPLATLVPVASVASRVSDESTNAPAGDPAIVAPAAAPSHTKRTIGWMALGAGAVAGGFATVYAATSFSRAAGRDDARAAGKPNLADAYDDQASVLAAYAWIAGGIGLACIGSGVWLLASDSPSRSAVQVTPTLRRDGAGLHIGAAF